MDRWHLSKETETRFDESYIKLTKFLRSEPTREKLKKFMKQNPSLIIYAPKERMKASHKKFEEHLKATPAAAKAFKEKPKLRKKTKNRKGEPKNE